MFPIHRGSPFDPSPDPVGPTLNVLTPREQTVLPIDSPFQIEVDTKPQLNDHFEEPATDLLGGASDLQLSGPIGGRLQQFH